MTRLLLILFAAAMVLSGQASAAEPPDFDLLQEVVCAHETNGSRWPDLEIGMHGEVGRCQVRITTAQQHGFDSPPAMLLVRPINESWAREILRQGWRRHKTLFGTLYAYNAGPRAPIHKDHASWSYAYENMMRYYAVLVERKRTLFVRGN